MPGEKAATIRGLSLLLVLTLVLLESGDGFNVVKVPSGLRRGRCRQQALQYNRIIPRLIQPSRARSTLKCSLASGRENTALSATTLQSPESVKTHDATADEAASATVQIIVRNRCRDMLQAKLKLTRDDADSLMALSKLMTVKPGEFLIREGPEDRDKGRELFFIVEGAVRIEVRGNRVAKLTKGDFVGEASFVSGRRGGPRSVTAITLGREGTTYLVWQQAVLRRFLQRRPELNQMLMAAFVAQLSGKLLTTMTTYSRLSSPWDELDMEEMQYGAEYGFRTWRVSEDSDTAVPFPSDPLARATPGSALRLGHSNFRREYQAIRRAIRFGGRRLGRGSKPIGQLEVKDGVLGGLDVVAVLQKAVLLPFAIIDEFLETVGLFPVLRPPKAFMSSDPQVVDLQSRLQLLTLSNEAIAERERRRRELQGAVVSQGVASGLRWAQKVRKTETPFFVLLPYYALCTLLDVVFDGRPLARFWFLETVARMPYFSYISMLHLYETLGWWTVGNDVRKVHFAEEWNEMHHLQIMESLGGDALWFDRFFARHSAIVYYWLLNLLFVISPRLAYNFSELIESLQHAVDTYSQFVEENEELLKQLPPPKIAIEYYMTGDLYMFDEFQTARRAYSRRPVVRNLYDVFSNIRDDELEHVRTVNACQLADEVIVSPNAAAANARWAEPSDALDEELVEEELEREWTQSDEAFGSGRPYDGDDEDDLDDPNW